jgi:hypothetical protein
MKSRRDLKASILFFIVSYHKDSCGMSLIRKLSKPKRKDDDQQDINMAPIWFYDTWHTKELDHPSDPSPASIPD